MNNAYQTHSEISKYIMVGMSYYHINNMLYFKNFWPYTLLHTILLQADTITTLTMLIILTSIEGSAFR